MLNKIPKNERDMIEAWIAKHGEDSETGIVLHPEDRATFDEVFSVWEGEKQTLFKALGNELILSKPINIELSDKVIRHRIERQLRGHRFVWEEAERLEKVQPLLTASALVSNVWEGDSFTIPLPDNKVLRVEKGSKVIRTLGKIAQAFNLPSFEEFRVLHSQLVNDRVIKGDMCLSIHPLDYLTMSDNNAKWSSCMRFSFERRGNGFNFPGCYRSGVLEMMNSPYVIEAYVRDHSTLEMPNGQRWNSKKWRTLIVVSPKMITTIKSYPYQSSALSRTAVDWVRELVTQNLGWTYHGETAQAWSYEDGFTFEQGGRVTASFESDLMYNDFGECRYHFGFVSTSFDPTKADDCYLNYSGPRVCLWCGKEESGIDDDCDLHHDYVICKDCNDAGHCSGCDRHIPMGSLLFSEGQPYCETCYELVTVVDVLTGRRRGRYYSRNIYLVPEGDIDNIIYYSDISKLSYFETNAYSSINYTENQYETHFKIANPRVHSFGLWYSIDYFYPSDCTEAGLALFGQPEGITGEC